MKKERGFTLIELLAVIIILGVLMIIAIPSVTKYIDDSRKNGYVSTAKSIAGGARNLIYSGELGLDDKTVTYYIDGKCINTDNGYKSPYGELEKAYVAVVLDGDNYEYYWMSVDDTNTGVATLKNANKLESDDIVGDIDPQSITPTIGIDRRNTIIKIEGEGCAKSNPEPATRKMNTKTGKVSDPCPSVTPTIYWALQEPKDYMDDYHKLVISDSPVTGGESGSFPGNVEFQDDYDVPWNGWSYYISEIEINGVVAPKSLRNWFSDIGAGATSFNADLSNLEVCNVTDMHSMFSNAGKNATSWSIEGLNTWDTSNVTDMEYMFIEAGWDSETINLDLSGWDTSSVESMHSMFYQTGYGSSTSFNLNLSNWTIAPDAEYMFDSAGAEATTFLINTSGWDTSKLTTGYAMFQSAGEYSTNWSIIGINNWNTSNLVNIGYMFNSAAYNATSINLDLSNWNVSKVTNIYCLFYCFGRNATTFNLNLSNWNLANVTTCYYLFEYAGDHAENYTLNLSNWTPPGNVITPSHVLQGTGGEARSLTLNVSNWNISHLTSLHGYFYGFGVAEEMTIIGLNTWDTSTITDMGEMFKDMGTFAKRVNLDLSNWNVSNVTNMYAMFSEVGYNSITVNINISGWNMSNVSSIGDLFDRTGYYASTVDIIIPRTNGNGINNTTTTIYSTSEYNRYVLSNGYFTLAS